MFRQQWLPASVFAAMALTLTPPAFAASQPKKSNDADFAVTCAKVQIDMPTRFGSGWHGDRANFVYPSATMSQFRYLGMAGSGWPCGGKQANSRGYLVGTYHFTVHGPMTAFVRIIACAPNGHRIFAKIPVPLPNPPSVIKATDEQVKDRGKCE